MSAPEAPEYHNSSLTKIRIRQLRDLCDFDYVISLYADALVKKM